MKKFISLLAVALIVGLVGAANVFALDYTQNITIKDKVGTGTGWYGEQEDNEVEPGCLTGQEWDLEGFYLDGATLTMVGGFDFLNGFGGYASGDIFINYLEGTPIYGEDIDSDSSNTNHLISNDFGWDYALRFASDGSWQLFGLTEDTQLLSAQYAQNDESSPWRVADDQDGLEVESFGTAGDVLYDSFSDGQGTHYVVQIDLNKVFSGGYISSNSNYFKFTMQCGNDNLVGRDPVVPEPATLLLLGAGLIGVFGLGRKQLKK